MTLLGRDLSDLKHRLLSESPSPELQREAVEAIEELENRSAVLQRDAALVVCERIARMVEEDHCMITADAIRAFCGIEPARKDKGEAGK